MNNWTQFSNAVAPFSTPPSHAVAPHAVAQPPIYPHAVAPGYPHPPPGYPMYSVQPVYSAPVMMVPYGVAPYMPPYGVAPYAVAPYGVPQQPYGVAQPHVAAPQQMVATSQAVAPQTAVAPVKKQETPSIKGQVTIIRDSNFTYFTEAYNEIADESVLTNSSGGKIPKMKILVVGSRGSGKTSVINWLLHREFCKDGSSTASPSTNMMKNNILVDKSSTSSSTALTARQQQSSSTLSSTALTTAGANAGKIATEYHKTVSEPGIGNVEHYYVEVNGDFIRNRDAVARLATKSFDAIMIVIDHTRLDAEFEILQIVIDHLRPILSGEQGKKLMIVKTKCDEAYLLTRSQDALSAVERQLREIVRENQFYYFEYLSLLPSQSTTKIGPSFGNRLFKFFLPLLAAKTRAAAE